MARSERLRKEIGRRSKRSNIYRAISLPCFALAVACIVLSASMNDARILCSAVLLGFLGLFQWSMYTYHQAVIRTLTILLDAEEDL